MLYVIMKISLQWIKEFVEIPRNISPQKLGEILTSRTAEIEGLEKIKNDTVYEIDNKSITHRPDLWGLYGIAREIAAITGGKLKKLNIPPIAKPKRKKIDIQVKIENKKDCPRYMALALGNIIVKPSPSWVKERLELAGVRSINNIVDATNYAMLETGQPLHAFDLDLLEKSKFKNKEKIDILVRRAKKGESIVNLDDNKRDLQETMTVIADRKDPIALAGITGGAKAEIKESTTRIILESANFDPVNIRKTASALGLRTEASARFEKSLDPYLTETGMLRVYELIKKLVPEVEVLSDVVDKKNLSKAQSKTRAIKITLEEITRKIGTPILLQHVSYIFENLGFEVSVKKSPEPVFTVMAPTWRATRDVSIAEDLIEEIARVYGYGNIPARLPITPVKPPLENYERVQERTIKDIFIRGLGFTEVLNYSFVSEQQLSSLGLSSEGYIRVKNPISKNATLMRQSLIPHLIENTKNNLRYFDDFRLFEIGRVYKNESGKDEIFPGQKVMLPSQDKMLSGIYLEKSNKAPFYGVKQAIETLLKNLNIVYNYGMKLPGNVPYVHPFRYVSIVVHGEELGYITELHPMVATRMDIKTRVGMFELNFSKLVRTSHQIKHYQTLPKYPSSKLDISILVDKKVLWKDIEDMVKGIRLDLIRSVDLFDIYEGKGLPENKKSLAFRIEYRSDKKTLTDQEISEVHAKVMKKLEEIGGEVRK